ncbi:MAG: hypothetical protein ABIR62_03490 [Dokdonella sp.]
MKIMMSVAALSLVLASGMAAAQINQGNPAATKDGTNTPTRGKAMTGNAAFDELDTNKDGFITKEELKGSPALITHFNKIDTDHDMKISQGEWAANGHNSQ